MTRRKNPLIAVLHGLNALRVNETNSKPPHHWIYFLNTFNRVSRKTSIFPHDSLTR